MTEKLGTAYAANLVNERLGPHANADLDEWVSVLSSMINELLAKWGDIDDHAILLEKARSITSIINATEFGKGCDLKTYVYTKWFPTMRVDGITDPACELLCWRRDVRASTHIMANPTISDCAQGLFAVNSLWNRRAQRSGMENQLLECAIGYIYANLQRGAAISTFDLDNLVRLVNQRESKRKSPYNMSTKHLTKGFANEIVYPDSRPMLLPSFVLAKCCSPFSNLRSSIQNTITLALNMLRATAPCYPGIRCVKLPVRHLLYDEIVITWRQADIPLDTTVFSVNRVLFLHLNGPRVCYQIGFATPVCDGLCSTRVLDVDTVEMPFVECMQRRSRAGVNIGGSVGVLCVLKTRETVYVTANNYSTQSVGYMFKALRMAVGKYPDYDRIKIIPWRFFSDKVQGRFLLEKYYVDRDRTMSFSQRELYVANRVGTTNHVEWTEHSGSVRQQYITYEFSSVLDSIAIPYTDVELANLLLPQIVKDASHDTWFTNNPQGIAGHRLEGEAHSIFDQSSICTHSTMAFSIFPHKLDEYIHGCQHYNGFCATIIGGFDKHENIVGQMCLFVGDKGYRETEFLGTIAGVPFDFSPLLERDNSSIFLHTEADGRSEERRLRDMFSFALSEISSRLQFVQPTNITLVPINKRRVSDSDDI
jgi:hypothetical protein